MCSEVQFKIAAWPLVWLQATSLGTPIHQTQHNYVFSSRHLLHNHMTMLLIYFVSHIIRHNYDPTHNETQSNYLPSIQQDRAARNIIVFIISKGYASPERPRWCRMRCPKTGHIMRHTCTSHVNMLKAMPMLHIYAKDRPNYSTHRIKGFVYSSLNGLLLLPFFWHVSGGGLLQCC